VSDQEIASKQQVTGSHATETLPSRSVYRSVEGRAEFQAYYQKSLDLLEQHYETKLISTRFGETHVTMTGNKSGTPIMVLPGMSIAGPMMLDFFKGLAKDHWLIAPDLVGQPGRSADVPFTHKHNNYGYWLLDLLDGLNIEKIDIAGASFGGAIGLDLFQLAPERVGKQALIVTAGLTPKLPLMKIYATLLFSWLYYRFFPNKGILATIASPLSKHLTQDNLEYLDLIIRQTAFWRHRPAGPFSKRDLASEMQPVFIVFARNDIMFPYEQTNPHAHEVLPIQKEFTLVESAHMPGDEEMLPIHKEIADYFNT